MITDFDDFVTCMYVLIDTIWQQIERFYQRPGSQPECSDHGDCGQVSRIGQGNHLAS
jgi:hypothetical protein